jgi:hypothetical protein
MSPDARTQPAAITETEQDAGLETAGHRQQALCLEVVRLTTIVSPSEDLSSRWPADSFVVGLNV